MKLLYVFRCITVNQNDLTMQPETTSTLELAFDHSAEEEFHVNWDQEIADLEVFFSEIDLPEFPVKLNRFTTILDPASFLQIHLSTVKANKYHERFQPYLDRLILFKERLTSLAEIVRLSRA